MSLITKIKLNAVTNLSDARYCAGMGVSYIGFCLDANNINFLEPSKLNAIAQWIAGVGIIFEFDAFDEEAYQINSASIAPEFIQVNQCEDWNLLTSTAVPIIHRMIFNNNWNELFAAANNSAAQYILIDNLDSESILNKSEELATLCDLKQIAISGNIHKDHAVQLVNTYNLWAIAIDGGEEQRIGIKNFDDMADFFEAIEVE